MKIGLHASDATAIALALAGLAGSGLIAPLGDSIDAFAPGHGKAVVGFVNTLCIVSAVIVRILTNKTPTTTALVKDEATQQNVVVGADPTQEKGHP